MKFTKFVVPAAFVVTACGPKHSSNYHVELGGLDQTSNYRQMVGPSGVCSQNLIDQRDQLQTRVDNTIARIEQRGYVEDVTNSTRLFEKAHSWLKTYRHIG